MSFHNTLIRLRSLASEHMVGNKQYVSVKQKDLRELLADYDRCDQLQRWHQARTAASPIPHDGIGDLRCAGERLYALHRQAHREQGIIIDDWHAGLSSDDRDIWRRIAELISEPRS